jgi:hypothetical protein
MMKALKLAALAAIATTTLLAPASHAYTTTRKFHPGHYTILLRANSAQRYMDEAARQPGTVGIVKKYQWRELEPTQGNYTLSAIQADLDWARAYGMQLIIMIEDKTFKLERPNPGYLDSLTPRNRANGYTMLRFHPTIVARYKALTTAIGKRFDSHPSFEGIAQQESALGLDSSQLQQYGYTAEKYRDALISSFTHALAAMPRSRVFWYQNYFVGNQSYIGTIAAATGPKGLVMAGPDVLPDKASLVEKSYPFFTQYKDKMHLGIQVENICYFHEHKTAGYSTKYWTPAELFRYARDKLHVDYMFWVRIPKDPVAGAYNWYDALPVIEANPVF